jgi:hypothetical protein
MRPGKAAAGQDQPKYSRMIDKSSVGVKRRQAAITLANWYLSGRLAILK